MVALAAMSFVERSMDFIMKLWELMVMVMTERRRIRVPKRNGFEGVCGRCLDGLE